MRTTGGGEEGFALTSITAGDEVFELIPIELEDPATGRPHQARIIAIIDSQISFWGLYTN